MRLTEVAVTLARGSGHGTASGPWFRSHLGNKTLHKIDIETESSTRLEPVSAPQDKTINGRCALSSMTNKSHKEGIL